MDDSEVRRQIDHMVAFIEQEAEGTTRLFISSSFFFSVYDWELCRL